MKRAMFSIACIYSCLLFGCATPNEQLQNAIYEGNLEQAQQSLKNGADPCSALDYAVERKQINIARLLLSHGANPNQVNQGVFIDDLSLIDTKTNTLFPLGRSHGQYVASVPDDPNLTDQVIIKLLSSEHSCFRYKIKDMPARTPLYTAIDNNDMEMIRLLLEFGADAKKPLIVKWPRFFDPNANTGSWDPLGNGGGPSADLIYSTLLNEGGDIVTNKMFFLHRGGYILSSELPAQSKVATAIEYTRSQGKTELVQILESSEAKMKGIN